MQEFWQQTKKNPATLKQSHAMVISKITADLKKQTSEINEFGTLLFMERYKSLGLLKLFL